MEDQAEYAEMEAEEVAELPGDVTPTELIELLNTAQSLTSTARQLESEYAEARQRRDFAQRDARNAWDQVFFLLHRIHRENKRNDAYTGSRLARLIELGERNHV